MLIGINRIENLGIFQVLGGIFRGSDDVVDFGVEKPCDLFGPGDNRIKLMERRASREIMFAAVENGRVGG